MPVNERLYLDHAATTPLIPAALGAMQGALERWANPSSPHAEGRAAKSALEDARTRIANMLGWDGEIIFTSGASEALSTALTRAKANESLVSAIEHDAVLRSALKAQILPVDEGGAVAVETLAAALSKDHSSEALVAVQMVNNETGLIQPLDELIPLVREAGGVFLADCSQSAGKLPLPDADMIALSAHKLGGPPGIGALLVRDFDLLTPSGGQERGYRGGTENLPAIMGFAAALESGFAWMAEATHLRSWFDDAIRAGGGRVVADHRARLATISSYHMPGVSASSQLIGFDMAGIAVSAGSACSSGTLKTSHVLAAMGWDSKAASEVVRISFGPQTTKSDLERFMAVWQSVYDRNKAL
jgi:cysteine desulfurase